MNRINMMLLVAVVALAGMSGEAAELGRSTPVTINNAAGFGNNPATGLQVSLCNPLQLFPENFDVSGLRINLIYGRNSNLRGLDVGLVNDVPGVVEGFQCGIGNLAGDLNGLQIGCFNSAMDSSMGLCQIGAVNIGKDISGVQIGVFNMCNTISGVQIGVINLITQSDFLIFCPFINAQF